VIEALVDDLAVLPAAHGDDVVGVQLLERGHVLAGEDRVVDPIGGLVSRLHRI
jgi:hypothetical protein